MTSPHTLTRDPDTGQPTVHCTTCHTHHRITNQQAAAFAAQWTQTLLALADRIAALFTACNSFTFHPRPTPRSAGTHRPEPRPTTPNTTHP